MKQDFQLIQKYYNFQLTEEEFRQFKARMEEDENFAMMVYKYHMSQKEASDFYGSEEEKILKGKWSSMLEDSTSSTKKKASFHFSYKSLAAAIILLIIGLSSVYYLFKVDNSTEWNNLIVEAKEMSPEVEVNILRGNSENPEEELFRDAYDFYLVEDYESAILLFNKITENNPDYNQAILLEAISYYQLNNYEKSLSLLDRLNNTAPKKQKEVVLWFKSLNYLNQKKIEKAKISLKQLTASDEERATKLLTLITEYQSKL